jgi:uncharacterized protein (TIGR02246 family)
MSPVEDEFAVLMLMHRYAFAIDDADADLIAEMFTDDGLFVSPIDGAVRGREEIRHLITRKRARKAAAHVLRRHYITNPVVVINGDEGTVRASVLVARLSAGTMEIDYMGHYHCRAVKHDDTWRFAERHCVPDQLTD